MSRYRGSGKNLRTGLIRILKAGGMTPWPKLFVNLRVTCRTELQERFPDHVVNAWLGHSSRIAQKHYLQVTADHWALATREIGGNAGGNICANPQGSTAVPAHKKQEIHHPEGDRFPVILDLAPRVIHYANTGSLNWEPFVSTTYVDRRKSSSTLGTRFQPFRRPNANIRNLVRTAWNELDITSLCWTPGRSKHGPNWLDLLV